MQLNNNLSALQAYTALTRTNEKIDASSMRLASGYRINSVKDDAAGLAITNKLRTQIRGLDMAERNSYDGISAIQTAEGALQEITNMLQRIRELAIQSANDTNTADDRRKIQEEVSSLIEEVDATVSKTEFNKIKLLGGACARLTKADAANVVPTDVTYTSSATPVGGLEFTVNKLGRPAEVRGVQMSGFPTGTDVTIMINDEFMTIGANDTAQQALDKLLDLCEQVNVKIDVMDTGANKWDDFRDGTLSAILYTTEAGKRQEIWMDGDGLSYFGLAKGSFKGEDAEVVSATVNGAPYVVDTDGNRVTLKGTGEEKVVVNLKLNELNEGNNGVWDWTTGKGANVTDYDDASLSADATKIELLDFGQLILQVGPNKNMEMSIQIPEVTAYAMKIVNAWVGSQMTSEETIHKIDDALSYVLEIRARLGAYQNRLEHTVASLANTSESTSQALSRIFDTDMAFEMAQLAQNNIMSQAGIAIMAQANQRPQGMLQLIGNH